MSFNDFFGTSEREKITIDRSVDGEISVSNAKGATKVYSLDDKRRITRSVGEAIGNCAVQNAFFGYDQFGYAYSIGRDSDGSAPAPFVTLVEARNEFGWPTIKREGPIAHSNEVKTSITWKDTGERAPRVITNPDENTHFVYLGSRPSLIDYTLTEFQDGDSERYDYSYEFHTNDVVKKKTIVGPTGGTSSKIVTTEGEEYDNQGRLVREFWADKQALYSNFDLNGHPRTIKDDRNNGINLYLTYDDFGNVLTRKEQAEGRTDSSTWTYTYEYPTYVLRAY